MRILVVDDFHSAWFLLSAVLDADHHHLDWSPDPADAARKVKSARYGLALVDLDFGRGAPESGLTVAPGSLTSIVTTLTRDATAARKLFASVRSASVRSGPPVARY